MFGFLELIGSRK